MWIQSVIGTFSIVQKKPTDAFLTIRARRLIDLKRLQKQYLPSLKIESEKPALANDYPFRGTALKTQVANALSDMACAIDYSNFKDAAKLTQGPDVGDIYMQVWGVLRGLERPGLRHFDHASVFAEVDASNQRFEDYTPAQRRGFGLAARQGFEAADNLINNFPDRQVVAAQPALKRSKRRRKAGEGRG